MMNYSSYLLEMKPGPKKRVFERVSISLGKGQKRGLETLAKDKDVSVADLVRRAVNRAYGNAIQKGA
jgi:hypothetical protein